MALLATDLRLNPTLGNRRKRAIRKTILVLLNQRMPVPRTVGTATRRNSCLYAEPHSPTSALHLDLRFLVEEGPFCRRYTPTRQAARGVIPTDVKMLHVTK